MKLRALFLPCFIGSALSGIYFLPKVSKVAESAVRMELPDSIASWELVKIPPSEKELKALSADTQFSKAQCYKSRRGEVSIRGELVPDRLDLSIVLSGADINNSIHRPERCMPAQGHTITASSDQMLALENGRQFQAKRLLSIQEISTNRQLKERLKLKCITYYFFVGHDHLTNDHLGRTMLDMKDRLIRGIDQRWAYVSVSMWYGKLDWIDPEVTEAEADRKLRQFLTGFSAEQIAWDQIVR